MIKKALETLFYSAFIIAGLIVSIILCCTGDGYKIAVGVAGLVLLVGEMAFLIPKIVANIAVGRESKMIFGYTKAFASVTRILFLILLYHICIQYYGKPFNMVTGMAYIFGTFGVIMIVLPQNQWGQNKEPNILWKAIRNIPLFCLGLVVILCYAVEINYTVFNPLNFYWVGIFVFLLFYLPVFLLEEKNSNIELFMIPSYLALTSILVLGLFIV